VSDVDTFLREEVPAAFAAALESLEEAAQAAAAEGDAEKAAKLERKLQRAHDVAATVRFQLAGEGGGDYYFNQFDGVLEVGDEGKALPIVWVTEEVGHFEALRGSGINPVALGQSGGLSRGGRAVGSFSPGIIEQIREMDSVLKIVLSDLPGVESDVETLIRLGEKATRDEPDMTMTLSYDTVEEIRSGRLPAPAAFMQGRIRIEGDMSIAMRLASLTMTGGG
jgi:hypothetical protein